MMKDLENPQQAQSLSAATCLPSRIFPALAAALFRSAGCKGAGDVLHHLRYSKSVTVRSW